MKVKKSANRWRKWSSRFGENRYEEAQKDIATLSSLGLKAKIWAPLHQHKTSEHVHVSVLCTQNQLDELDALIEHIKNLNDKHVLTITLDQLDDLADLMENPKNELVFREKVKEILDRSTDGLRVQGLTEKGISWMKLPKFP